jgi:hypothetical protein
MMWAGISRGSGGGFRNEGGCGGRPFLLSFSFCLIFPFVFIALFNMLRLLIEQACQSFLWTSIYSLNFILKFRTIQTISSNSQINKKSQLFKIMVTHLSRSCRDKISARRLETLFKLDAKEQSLLWMNTREWPIHVICGLPWKEKIIANERGHLHCKLPFLERRSPRARCTRHSFAKGLALKK